MKNEQSGLKSDQPAAANESQSAEDRLRSIIVKFAATHLQLVCDMRAFLKRRLPTSYEVVYEYRDCLVISCSPSEHGYEGVLAIRAGETVQLYFNRGTELPDPEKLLKGSGKQTRLINVENISVLDVPAVARLIEESIARNTVAFESAGSGGLVFRSSATKQRTRTRTA